MYMYHNLKCQEDIGRILFLEIAFENVEGKKNYVQKVESELNSGENSDIMFLQNNLTIHCQQKIEVYEKIC